jgi:hypothetical protein
MKKLLLGCLLLFSSFICIAQDTFVEKYTSVVSVSDYKVGEWQDTEMTVVFNAKGLKDVVFYYPNATVRTMHQVTPSRKGTTENGNEYQIIECIDDSGERVALQLFSSTLRVLISDGYYVEFHNN